MALQLEAYLSQARVQFLPLHLLDSHLGAATPPAAPPKGRLLPLGTNVLAMRWMMPFRGL